MNINEYIKRKSGKAHAPQMTPEEAVQQGAMALFDEKYGDTVRVVSMGQGANRLSCELCGGTHVRATGDIGQFRIVSESAVSAGVRRIEAVVGTAALVKARENDAMLADLMNIVKSTSATDMKTKIQHALEDKKRLEKEIADLRQKLALAGGNTATDTETINRTAFIGKILTDTPAKELKPLADEFKKKIGSGVVALIAANDDKVSIVIGVTADLTDKINAVDLVRAAAEAVGGKGGGGRPDMAQAGGSDTSRMSEALTVIRGRLKG